MSTSDPSPASPSPADVPPGWPEPAPMLPFRQGIRGIVGAGYRWAVLGLPDGSLPGDQLYLGDGFIRRIVGRLASDIDDPEGRPEPGWVVERRTRRRVLVVCDPVGWRVHEG